MPLTIKARTTGAVIATGKAEETVIPFEGNWYFAPENVNMQHLKVTQRTYTCPYKGVCFWIDLATPNGYAQNIAWVYNNPKPGYEFIKDQIGFYARNTSGTMVEETEDRQEAASTL
jgi:uncharacterized protein (DUF427 family)